MDEEQEFVVRSLERVPTRLRENSFTQTAWRMVIECPRGSGAVTMIDDASGSFYRGEGIFLGLSPDELRTMYQSLNKPSDEPAFDLPQLG